MIATLIAYFTTTVLVVGSLLLCVLFMALPLLLIACICKASFGSSSRPDTAGDIERGLFNYKNKFRK